MASRVRVRAQGVPQGWSRIEFMECLKDRKWDLRVPRGSLLGHRAYLEVRC